MEDQRGVSRRATLKGLGAMGAAVVLAGRSAGAQEKPGGNVVDVAAERFSKGHS